MTGNRWGTRIGLALFLTCGTIVSVMAVPTSAVAQDMSRADRRLYISLVPELHEADAEEALQAGADINLRDPASGNDTLLILAIRQFVDPPVIRWIVEHGGDPSLSNDEGRNAVSYARQLGGNSPRGREILRLLGATSPQASTAPTGRPRIGTAQAASPARSPSPVAIPQASGAMGGPPPQPGVYECINQSNVISPMAFGIIDGSTYMSSGGRRGRYAYNSGTGVLTLDPGASPARYQRIGATAFRVLEPSGRLGGFTCPLNRQKNPSRPPW